MGIGSDAMGAHAEEDGERRDGGIWWLDMAADESVPDKRFKRWIGEIESWMRYRYQPATA